jgi:hypothetical protein
MTFCGCKTCVCVEGGYQVHITYDIHHHTNEIVDFITNNGGEIIYLQNFIDIKKKRTYKEVMTSKNYKRYKFALKEMKYWSKIIKQIAPVVRLKIEAHPKNAFCPLYYEYHYKIKENELELYADKGCMLSFNKKGSLFATKRTNVIVEPIKKEFRLEAVIFDDNRLYDMDMFNYEKNAN